MSSSVSQPTSEWSIPDASIPVRQGDLLISRDPHAGQIDEICLVITADCDISKGKFGRQLACLRVMPLSDYVRTVWAARKLEKIIEIETEKLRAQLNKWNALRIGGESNLSAEAVTAWIGRESPEMICAALAIPEADQRKACTSISVFRSAIAALNDCKSDDKLRQYAMFRSVIQSKGPEVCWKDALQQAQNDKLPEDVFLLSGLPQVIVGPAVILLRELVGVSADAVCYRATDASTTSEFLRVGRLAPTFKYAVSQAFGSLYSRIGLPDDYERRCKAVMEQLTEIEWKS